MTNYSGELVRSTPTALEVADSYQQEETLFLHSYPTYGIDRVLLENRDVFDVHEREPYYPGMPHQPQPPEGIRDLFLERTKNAPQGRHNSGYSSYRASSDRLSWLLDQWRENYLDRHIIPVDRETELDAWKIITQKFEITDDDVRVLPEAPFRFSLPQLVIEDTHLVEGLWGSKSMSLIVPPGVKLTGDPGHCSILDTNATSLEVSDLPSISPDVFARLCFDGDIKRGPKSTAKALAQSALLV
ncbi:MAG: hypothetical protein WBP12_03115 [Candidatus Saccharimonas sp.]